MRIIRILCWSALLLMTAPCAQAQSYPAKLIRLVTGSSAGGGSDITSRQIAQRLVDALGQQIIVDNRPGLAGMLANELVTKAPADGYTLLLQPGSFITVSAHINSKGAWDPLKQLAPVIQVSAYDFVLVAHPSVPARSVKELIAVARARPGELTFASTGVGSNFHLSGELFKLAAKVNMWHVPYKGSPPAIVDLIAGRVDLMFVHAPSVAPHIRNGRLRALGVTGAKRNPLLPNVPTIAEAALPGYEISGSEGLLAPAGTPPEVVARLNTVVGGILAGQEMRDLWAGRGMEFVPNTTDQFIAKIRAEYERTGALIKAIGVKAE